MINKINILQIFSEQLKTFKDPRSEQINYFELFAFYVVPLILAIFLACTLPMSSSDFIKWLLILNSICIPIFVSTLFSVVSIGQGERFSPFHNISTAPDTKLQSERLLLSQICHNIMYVILTIIITYPLISVIILTEKSINSEAASNLSIINMIVYIFLFYLLIQTLLTFLMIIKRIHRLTILVFETNHI